ncbi:MAG: hypothetical protein C4534_09400 [Gaiellales bacterium]|jgi:hypothetical protein|nr:MAG: hypothetical protein C4534_09400 [Gaiellales bacterium]
MIEVWPKKIDRSAAQFELQRLVDAFLGVAESELSERKAAKSAPTHEKPALTMPLTLNSKTR